MTPYIELRGIGKRFRAVEALADIHLSIARGSIHALVGENGAGKSTLGKIVSGIIAPDSGEMLVNGLLVRYRSPRDALADGITTIQQEIVLLRKRSVIDNILLGLETRRLGVIDRADMRRRFDELLEQSGFKLKPETLVGELRIPDQKKVEILQAMARNARFIVMDEPTATLPDDETRQFLEIVRQLNERGTTIVYISHFLLEVLNCADTVTVLRNGRLIRTAPSKDESTDSLITAMLGRSMSTTFPSKQFPGPNAPTVFGVRNLTRKGILENISFQIREGEIVGVAGLVGSGRSRMARTIFGAEAHDRGEIEVDGKQIVIRSPSDAVRAGIAMLPESRKTQGLSLRLSVGHNVVMPHLDLISHGPLIDERKERAQTVELLRQLDVRPAEPQMRVNNLSGGNQQKVMFAKWLFRRPRLLIADEPTRGVDVGAKRAIYHLITSLAADGIAVLFISSEIEEILGLAHRVLVMRRGMIVAQIEDDGKSLTENAVIRAAFAADSRDDHFAEDA